MNIFKERIFPLFQSSKMSDQELEREIDLPRGIIYDWKKGRTKSYKKYCGQIASYFHVSTDYLLGNTDDPTPTGQKEKPPSNKAGPVDPLDINLMDGLRALTREQKELLLAQITAWKDMK